MSSEIMKIFGIVQTQSDDIIAQIQVLLASYPVLWGIVGLVAWGIVKKVVKMIVLAVVLGIVWIALRGNLTF